MVDNEKNFTIQIAVFFILGTTLNYISSRNVNIIQALEEKKSNF